MVLREESSVFLWVCQLQPSWTAPTILVSGADSMSIYRRSVGLLVRRLVRGSITCFSNIAEMETLAQYNIREPIEMHSFIDLFIYSCIRTHLCSGRTCSVSVPLTILEWLSLILFYRRCQESVRDFGDWIRFPIEQNASSCRWRHGNGICQERKART